MSRKGKNNPIHSRRSLLKKVGVGFATALVLGGMVGGVGIQNTYAEISKGDKILFGNGNYQDITNNLAEISMNGGSAKMGLLHISGGTNDGQWVFCIQPFNEMGTVESVQGVEHVAQTNQAEFSSLSDTSKAMLINVAYYAQVDNNGGDVAYYLAGQIKTWSIITGTPVSTMMASYKDLYGGVSKARVQSAIDRITKDATDAMNSSTADKEALKQQAYKEAKAQADSALPVFLKPSFDGSDNILIFGNTLKLDDANKALSKNPMQISDAGIFNASIAGDTLNISAKKPVNQTSDVKLKSSKTVSKTVTKTDDGGMSSAKAFIALSTQDMMNSSGTAGVPVTVSATAESTATAEATVHVKEIATGEAKLVKTATNPNYNKYIKGAEYQLYGDDTASKSLNQKTDGIDLKTGKDTSLQLLNDKTQTFVNDADATIKVGDAGVADTGFLNLGKSMDYSWKETKPAKGFAKDPTVHKVNFTPDSPLNADKTALIENATSQDKPIGELNIDKDDLQAGAETQGNATIEGTEIMVVDADKNPVKLGTAVDPETGENTADYKITQGTLTDDNDGNLVIKVGKGEDGKYGIGVQGLDVSSSTKYGGLEVKSPYGYTKNTVPVFSDDYFKQAPNEDGYFEQNVTIHNSAIRFSFAFSKTSDDQGEGGTFLNGAEFTLTPREGTNNNLGSEWETGLNASPSTVVSHDITDAEGYTRGGWVNFDNIPVGEYDFVESKAPQGYKPVNPMEVVISPKPVTTGGVQEYTLTITDTTTGKVLYTHTTQIDQENEDGFGYNDNVSMGKFNLGNMTDKGLVPTIKSQAYNATEKEEANILVHYQEQVESLTAQVKEDQDNLSKAQTAGNVKQAQAYSDKLTSSETALSHAQQLIESLQAGGTKADSAEKTGEWKANQKLGVSKEEKAGDIVQGTGLTPDTTYYYNNILFDQETGKAVEDKNNDLGFVYTTGEFKTDENGNYSFAIEEPTVDTTAIKDPMVWVASIYSEKAPTPDGTQVVPAGNPVVYDETPLKDNLSETLTSSKPVMQTKAHMEDGSQLIKEKSENTVMYDDITSHQTLTNSDIGSKGHAYLWRLVPDKTGYTATKVATVDFDIDNQFVVDQMKTVQATVDTTKDNDGVKYVWSEEIRTPDDKTVISEYNKDLKDEKETLTYPSRGGGDLTPAVDTGASSDNTGMYVAGGVAVAVLAGGSLVIVGRRKHWFGR